MVLSIALALLSGYLIGSVPNGLLIGKARGIDIRQHGSGNIGATNAFRVLGKKWGILVFILDFLKGLIAVQLAIAIGGARLSPAASGIIGGLAAIIGHNFPCWLRFKGGKGIATSGGVLVGLLPVVTAILIPVWAIVFFTTRYVSVASIAVAVALPIIVVLLYGAGGPLFWFALVVCALAVWRHRSNIKRLMEGTENRFERKKR